jgi:UDP-N-acetylmuramate dehydrogenase
MVSALPSFLRTDVSLAEMTTLGLGGAARLFVEATDEATVLRALAWAKERGVPWALLGGGSNVIVPDEGVDGLVVRVATKGLREDRDGDGRAGMRVAAGEAWDDFVGHCCARGLTGVECLSGIPGSVGATLVQNVGAYGQDVSQTFVRARVLDPDTLGMREISPAECRFAYRASAFKDPEDPLSRAVILELQFALARGEVSRIAYPELARALSRAHEGAAGPADVRRVVLSLRAEKSMVLSPTDPNRRSVGSFFTNPVVSSDLAARVGERAVERGLLPSSEGLPQWAAGDGRVKLSAAWLIERAGFARGYREGNVGISSRHALALVHHGGGSARELLAFAERITDGVRAAWGVALEREPVVLRARR